MQFFFTIFFYRGGKNVKVGIVAYGKYWVAYVLVTTPLWMPYSPFAEGPYPSVA